MSPCFLLFLFFLFPFSSFFLLSFLNSCKEKYCIIYQMNDPWQREFWNNTGKTKSLKVNFGVQMNSKIILSYSHYSTGRIWTSICVYIVYSLFLGFFVFFFPWLFFILHYRSVSWKSPKWNFYLCWAWGSSLFCQKTSGLKIWERRWKIMLACSNFRVWDSFNVIKSEYLRTVGFFCRFPVLFRHIKTKQNSENIFFTDREGSKTTILYIFLISQVGLQGNLKIDGAIEKKSHRISITRAHRVIIKEY